MESAVTTVTIQNQDQQTNEAATQSTPETIPQENSEESQLPGYQEACVIAENNLRELDMKSLIKRLKMRFVSTGVSLIVSGILLAIMDVVEINVAGDQTCLGLGIWSGCLFLLSGGVCLRVGRARRVSYCSMTSTIFFQYLGLGFMSVCFVLGLRDWMSYTTAYIGVYYLWQFIHIGKFMLGILIASFVAIMSFSYFRFFAKYRAHRLSTADDPTITTRTVSLFSILDELQNEDDLPKFVEPPPDYSAVILADSANQQPGQPTAENNPQLTSNATVVENHNTNEICDVSTHNGCGNNHSNSPGASAGAPEMENINSRIGTEADFGTSSGAS